MNRELFSGRISRRALIRGGALGGVGLATAAVIGCDDDDDDDAASTAPAAPAAPAASAPAASAPPVETVKTGKMTPAVVNPGNTLDPNTTAGSVQEFHAIYDTLARLDPETESIIRRSGPRGSRTRTIRPAGSSISRRASSTTA